MPERLHPLTLHLTAEEHAALEVVARLRGMTPAGVLLEHVTELGDRVGEELLADLVDGELAPVGRVGRVGREEMH